jgi:hypothetical protein
MALALAIVAGGTPRAGQQVRDAARSTTVPAAATAGAATISGTVLIAGQGRQPARRVRVTLNELDRRVPGQTTTTDDAGAFGFSGVPAGRFELQAFRNGFLRGSYGASRPDRPGIPVIVREGEAFGGLVLTIARGGVIAGVVRDRQGRPVSGVAVRVLRLGYSATTGEPALTVPAGSVISRTDDRGEYRAFGLPPGGYIVVAAPGPSSGSRGYGEPVRVLTSAEVQRALQSPPRAAGPAPQPAAAVSPPALLNYTPVFYPDATDISRARTVSLGVGEEQRGIDIAIELVAASTVSGRLSSPDGQWPTGQAVVVAPTGPSAGMLSSAGLGLGTMSAMPKPDHTYSIGGVLPGSYTVKAGNSTGSGRGAVVIDSQTVSGSVDITVAGSDIDAPITLAPGVPIAGRVTFEGATPTPAELQAMTFQLIPVGSGGTVFRTAGGRVDGSGQFTFASVGVDTYYLVLNWNAAGANARWAIKSTTANGRDAFEAPLRVAAGRPVDLSVVFTERPPVLQGVFQDRSGRPATDYFVLVFSADRTFWVPASRRIRTARPATDGSFDVRGLPPGDYLIAALADLEPGEWNDPTLLGELARSAIKVTLREGQTVTQGVQLGGG